MRSALQALPCVEPDSVKVSKENKEARFTAKKGSKCDIEEVKKAIAAAGSYRVTAVTLPKEK